MELAVPLNGPLNDCTGIVAPISSRYQELCRQFCFLMVSADSGMPPCTMWQPAVRAGFGEALSCFYQPTYYIYHTEDRCLASTIYKISYVAPSSISVQ
jgi:hypothetical protein